MSNKRKGKERRKGRATWGATRRGESLAVQPLQTNNGSRGWGLLQLPWAFDCNKGLLPSPKFSYFSLLNFSFIYFSCFFFIFNFFSFLFASFLILFFFWQFFFLNFFFFSFIFQTFWFCILVLFIVLFVVFIFCN